MLKRKWYKTTITTNKQANDMVRQFKELSPKVGAFDTETDGLHIILSKPFLFQFGYLHPTEDIGYTYAVDLERYPDLARQVIKVWNTLAESLELYLGHNVKFDLHMLTNINAPYKIENVSDTMFYIRHAHDALTPKNGGPPLGLKDYAARYIDRNAKDHERLLNDEKSKIVKDLNLRLKKRLNITMKALDDIFKDRTMDYSELPPNLKQGYLEWLHNDVPLYMQPKIRSTVKSDMVQYNKLNRENLIRYAHYDIVYTLEIYLSTLPVIETRGTMVGIEFENRIIHALVDMERVGFKVNKDYLIKAEAETKAYIRERRARMQELAGQQFSISQAALIKKILNDRFGVQVVSTGNEELQLLKNSGTLKPEAIEFIDVLEELRTLEKWYSTYIVRFLGDLRHTDRIYTTINQVGTVSGRVTSDFQQFPKGGIRTYDGRELFQPRRMVEVTGGKYSAISYLDYSQIELRFQALYTILVGHPDTNLCRAYMPYECVDTEGRAFDYNSPACIANWKSPHFYKENPKEKWVATDVHGATTKAAFGIDESHPDYHDLRYVGKRVNFAKNYGAQRGKIREMFPERTEEEITQIDNAYYTAFPGVKAYHEYCYNRAKFYSNTTNLFGVKYYGVTGHKLINMLVQGSAAYYLKQKIYELYKYSKEHNIKTRWQMQIHDELSWEYCVEDDLSVFFEFQRIMQDWSDGCVPIVADMEITTTTWADKKEVSTIEELREFVQTNTSV